MLEKQDPQITSSWLKISVAKGCWPRVTVLSPPCFVLEWRQGHRITPGVVGYWAGGKSVKGWNILSKERTRLHIWTSCVCVFSQGVLTHYPRMLGIGTVNTVLSSPVLVLRQPLFSGQHVLILNESSFKSLSLRGRLSLSDWEPAAQASSTVYAFSVPPPLYLWHAYKPMKCFSWNGNHD